LSALRDRPARVKKRAHELHECENAEELAAELEREGLDLVSLAYEFVKPSYEIGLFVTGSIPGGTASSLSDVDVVVLLPTVSALKGGRKRELFGSAVNYLPTDSPNETEVSLFFDGIELDVLFLADRTAGGEPASGSVVGDEDLVLATRLAGGWIIHGREVVERWRSRYSLRAVRTQWVAARFTEAGKILEDMEVGIGRARGHVACLGAHVCRYLVNALLAYHDVYSDSASWVLQVQRLAGTADPEMEEALQRGTELAFPTLLEGPEAERTYFEQVYAYCATVRELLSRDEEVGALLTSIIYDLDIILPAQPTS
jgi:hypothetical protein